MKKIILLIIAFLYFFSLKHSYSEIINQKNISEIIIGTNNFTKKKLEKYYQEFEKKNIRVRNISEIKNAIN